MWRKPVDREPTWFDLFLCYLSETKTENMYWNALLTITHRSPRRCIYIEWDWTQNNICIVQINSRTDEHKHTRTHACTRKKSICSRLANRFYSENRTSFLDILIDACILHLVIAVFSIHLFVWFFFCLSVCVSAVHFVHAMIILFAKLATWDHGKKSNIQVEIQMEIYSKNHENPRNRTVNLMDWIPDEFWCDKFSSSKFR